MALKLRADKINISYKENIKNMMLEGVIIMNYGFVTVKVNSLEESLKFYTEILSLKVINQFSAGPGVSIAFLSDDKGNKIELIENSHEKVSEEAKGLSLISIGFIVDSVDEIVELVNEKGIKIVRGPVQVPSGARLMYIEDPNGAEIEFIEGFNI
jgi:lactoylglutathione lyase